MFINTAFCVLMWFAGNVGIVGFKQSQAKTISHLVIYTVIMITIWGLWAVWRSWRDKCREKNK